MEKDDFTISEEEIKALVKESLEPTPRAGITRIEIDQLFVSARDSLQSLSKMVLDGLKPPSGAYAFFNHNAHALSQLQDCKKIVDRMYAGRIKLTDLSREQNSLMPKDWPTILNNIAKNNLKNIDLGKPFMTSEEMWKKRNK